MSSGRMMYEVGVEGDLFHPHRESTTCADAGCKPVGEPLPGGSRLTFAQLRKANVERLANFPGHTDSPWSPNDWAVAVTGELGELCNMLKKVRRGTAYPGMQMPTKEDIAGEIADVQIYLDLLAHVLEVDLAEATIRTFNKVSERWSLPQRL